MAKTISRPAAMADPLTDSPARPTTLAEQPPPSSSPSHHRAPSGSPDVSGAVCTARQSAESTNFSSDTQQSECRDPNPNIRHTPGMSGEPTRHPEFELSPTVNASSASARSRRQSTSERKKHQRARNTVSPINTSTVNSAIPTSRLSALAKQSVRRSNVASVADEPFDERHGDFEVSGSVEMPRAYCGNASSEIELWREVAHIRRKMAETCDSSRSGSAEVRAPQRDIDRPAPANPALSRRQEGGFQSLETSGGAVSQCDASGHAFPLVEARSVNVNADDLPDVELGGQNVAEVTELVDATPLKRMFWQNVAYALLAVAIVAVAVGASLAVTGRSRASTALPTSPPSPQPTLSPLARQFQNQLPDYTLAALDDPQSHQSQALEWIASKYENLAIDIGDADLNRIYQQFSLATIFYATDGASAWVAKGNWLNVSVHECYWFGCNCSADSAIDTLALSDHRLDGTLPRELGLLSKLRQVDLSSNVIRGPIHGEIALLTDLASLNLHENHHSGSIPDALGTLNHLETILLQSNNFSGRIPTSIGQLAQLKSLYLDNTGITGAIPTDIGGLSRLEELSLYNCALNSTIPPEIGGTVGLRRLDFSSNRGLTGPIPSQLGLLVDLEYLTLDSCSLSGTLPRQLGTLTKLAEVNISLNDLSGTLPSGLCDLVSSGLSISVDPEVLCDCEC
jgi:hypothetical protein